MVSHPENGSDSPIGSDRDRGRDSHTIIPNYVKRSKHHLHIIYKSFSLYPKVYIHYTVQNKTLKINIAAEHLSLR